MERSPEAAPAPVDDETVLSLLGELDRLLRLHPRLTRAVVAALVAEGRAYSDTTEGRRLRETLLASRRVRRAWVLWDTFGLGRHVREGEGFEPSWWLRTIATLTASDRLESLVSRHLMGGRAP